MDAQMFPEIASGSCSLGTTEKHYQVSQTSESSHSNKGEMW